MQGRDTQAAKRRQASSLLPEILPFGIPQQTGINRVLQTPGVQMACSTLSKCPAWSTLYSSQVSDSNDSSASYIDGQAKIIYGCDEEKINQGFFSVCWTDLSTHFPKVYWTASKADLTWFSGVPTHQKNSRSDLYPGTITASANKVFQVLHSNNLSNSKS